MKVAITTDTNSGITQAEAKDLGVFVLPMPVMIGEKTYLEGVDVWNEQLYAAMGRHEDLFSSQPAPGQYLELWDQVLGSGYDEVVYIPMSSGLSGSCALATQFAREYGGRVQVADNHRISVPQKESVLCALRLAEMGHSAREIKDYLEARAYDASIYISVESMEYLKKGGRITPAVAALATVLNLKPVLTIQGDKLDTYAKARGMKQAEAVMIEAARKDRETRFRDVPDSEIQVETAGTILDPEQAERWRQSVQAAFPYSRVSYAHLPCSIACHVGMNAVAIGIMKKEI